MLDHHILNNFTDLAAPPRLRGIDYSEQEISAAIQEDRPLQIGLMISRACNLACTYCYTAAGRPKAGELSFAEQKKLVSQAKALGARTLWVPGEGEPLLDKNFLSLVEYTNEIGMYVVFYTNGLLIDEKLARQLYSKRVSIVTKLNSFNPEVQDYLCNAKGISGRLFRAIDAMVNAGFAQDHRLAIESVIVKQNLEDIPELFRFCRQNSIIPYLEMLLDCGRAPLFDLQVGARAKERLFLRLLEIDQSEFGYTWAPQPPFAGGIWSCNRIVYHMVITSEGLAQPCVVYDRVGGSFREQSLEQLWQSSALRSFRAAALEKISHARQHGGEMGCFCSSYLKTGDPFNGNGLW